MIEIHKHNGIDTPRLESNSIRGFFETVTTPPTKVPRDFLDQIKLYKNGSNYLLYVYDIDNAAWTPFSYNP